MPYNLSGLFPWSPTGVQTPNVRVPGPEAEREYRAALALRRRTPGGQDADLANSEAHLAEQLTFGEKLPEEETLQRDALSLRTDLFGPDAVSVGEVFPTSQSHHGREGKLHDAETMLRMGVSIDLKNNRTQDAAADEHNLGLLLRFEKCPAEAEAILRRALAAHS
jgi:hypothetical protein